KTCEHLADTYRGVCFTNASCDDHCKNKAHLISGTCHNWKCFCTQNC
uniref:Defensin-1 n=2 Tax=Pisum sativum TaxID=3888 RepID=DEF1_PEA|nr:RecName: Full=Defensin-1; AltName: Full=Antifungal protein Psd1; AltName: Full=Defense-related peptide 1 [Pisum sativum]1JKZ_A Chain A, DEFENSE-RELATED PEPTIDE 1 [Pisum sativum]